MNAQKDNAKIVKNAVPVKMQKQLKSQVPVKTIMKVAQRGR